MKLSDVKTGGIVRLLSCRHAGEQFLGRRFVVVQRDPADRASGVTTVADGSGSRVTFVWDHDDPEVEYLGTGYVTSRVEQDYPQGKNYVLGFAFLSPPAAPLVVLLRKARPAWQAGRLNGVGGKIEAGESPRDAMVREFREETGLATPGDAWRHFATLDGGDHRVWCFTASVPFSDRWVSPDERTRDEPVTLASLAGVAASDSVLPNLKYLVPLAAVGGVEAVTFVDLPHAEAPQTQLAAAAIPA